jgi:hypothetical protein
MVTWTEGTAVDNFSLYIKCIGHFPVRLKYTSERYLQYSRSSRPHVEVHSGRKKDQKIADQIQFDEQNDPAAAAAPIYLCCCSLQCCCPLID